MYTYVCVVWTCACMCGCLWGPEEELDLLEVELQAVMSWPTWALWTKLRSTVRALHHSLSRLSLQLLFYLELCASVHAVHTYRSEDNFFLKICLYFYYLYLLMCLCECVHMGVHRVKKRMSYLLELGFPGVFELSNVLSIAGLEDREACSPNHWAIALAWWKTSGRQLSPSSMYSRVWSQMLRLAWRVLLSMEHPPELCWLGMM